MMDGLHLRIGHDGRVPSPYLFSDSNGLKHFKDTWLLLYKMSGREKREREREDRKGIHRSLVRRPPNAFKWKELQTHTGVFSTAILLGLASVRMGAPQSHANGRQRIAKWSPPPFFSFSHPAQLRLPNRAKRRDGRTDGPIRYPLRSE